MESVQTQCGIKFEQSSLRGLIDLPHVKEQMLLKYLMFHFINLSQTAFMVR